MELLKEKIMDKLNKVVAWCKDYKNWSKKDYIVVAAGVIAVIVVIANIVKSVIR